MIIDKENRIAIETEIGILYGRDAIYLDLLLQEFSKLEFEGEFNTHLCSKYSGQSNRIKYNIEFFNIIFFASWELDNYQDELKMASSFDIINNSNFIKKFNIKNKKHFVFSTYDFIYEIIAEDYQLVLKDE